MHILKTTLRRKQARRCSPRTTQSVQKKGAAMQGDLCKIAIVIRTIGAERGRAARGRPLIR